MKVVDIALKDLLRSFRNAIALVFMFVIPVAMTVIFYIMFGSSSDEGEFNVPQTKVIFVNQDQGSSKFQTPNEGMGVNSLGQILAVTLQSPEFSSLLDISLSEDAASARMAVDDQKAGVAVIVPANFTSGFLDPAGQTEIELYKDPTLTLGPGVVKSILDQLMDSFSGAKVAMNLAMAQAPDADPAFAGEVLQIYLADYTIQSSNSSGRLDTRRPDRTEESTSPLLSVVTQIMGGMMIFYAFYTGTASAQSILQEHENGTLARIFTTPTPHSTILAGKFLAVGLTVVIQMTTLVLFSMLVFHIRWGMPVSVALSLIGTVTTAATMGIFINSLLKDTRQGGAVFGGLLTITGMVGMMPIFTQGLSTRPAALDIIPLFVPQGWAIRSLFQAVEGESVIVSVLVLLAISAVFFIVGIRKFAQRFA